MIVRTKAIAQLLLALSAALTACDHSKCGSGTAYDTCFPPSEDSGSEQTPDASARGDGGPDAHSPDIDAALDASASPLDAQADVAPLLDATLGQDAGDATRPLSDAGYRFVLVNTSDAALYVQRWGFESTIAAFGLYEEGRAVVFDPGCNPCKCGPCSECAVCGRSVAKVASIDPGGALTFPWDGRVWERESMQCGNIRECQRPVGTLVGQASIEVRYSASFRVDTEFGANDEFLDEPIRTKRVDFRYVDGSETRVELP